MLREIRLDKSPFFSIILVVKDILGRRDRCLVVENVPMGIRSAKSAGLRCIAVTAYLGRGCLNEADLILDNHREIREYVARHK